jgi:hypothetical protein
MSAKDDPEQIRKIVHNILADKQDSSNDSQGKERVRIGNAENRTRKGILEKREIPKITLQQAIIPPKKK